MAFPEVDPSPTPPGESNAKFRMDWREVLTAVICWSMLPVAVGAGLGVASVVLFSGRENPNLLLAGITGGVAFVIGEVLTIRFVFRLKREAERRRREYARIGIKRSLNANMIANMVFLRDLAVGLVIGLVITGVYYVLRPLGLNVAEKITGFDKDRTLLAVFGGSSGAAFCVFMIYDWVRIIKRYLRGVRDFWKWKLPVDREGYI